MFNTLPALPYPIIDTHAHYDDAMFDGTRDELFKQMERYGVRKIINNSVDLKDSAKLILDLAQKYRICLSAVGIHPEMVERYGMALDTKRLKQLACDKSVVAIGEIGLDYHYSTDRKEQQISVFKEQCLIANELDLPVIIHDRDAHNDTFQIVNEVRPRGVIHCFSGSKELALQYVKLGFYIGIGGVLTFKNARKLVEVAETIPLDKILLETDAPYLAPVPFRGKQCNSALIYYTAQRLSEIKGIDIETVLKVAAQNASKLYGDRLEI